MWAHTKYFTLFLDTNANVYNNFVVFINYLSVYMEIYSIIQWMELAVGKIHW